MSYGLCTQQIAINSLVVDFLFFVVVISSLSIDIKLAIIHYIIRFRSQFHDLEHRPICFDNFDIAMRGQAKLLECTHALHFYSIQYSASAHLISTNAKQPRWKNRNIRSNISKYF